jgi:hypothetical protein
MQSLRFLIVRPWFCRKNIVIHLYSLPVAEIARLQQHAQETFRVVDFSSDFIFRASLLAAPRR